MKQFVKLLPPGVIAWIGRLQFRMPMIGPAIRYLGRLATTGECTIMHGLGKGLRFDNSLGFPGYALGTTEPEEQDALRRLLQKGSVYWNIGANIGFHAILGARAVGKEGKVVAFEPIHEAAVMIRRNASLNDMQNLEVVEKVVTAVSGEVEFFVGENSATNSMFTERQTGGQRILLPGICLDDYAAETHFPPDVISIDVEGAELKVLHGAIQTIKKHRPSILLENHWLQDDILNFFESQLRPLGYRWHEINFSDYRPKQQALREHSIFIVPSL